MQVLSRLKAHLKPEGRAVIGFGAGRDYDFADFLDDYARAGLVTDLLLSTWDLRPFGENSDFSSRSFVRHSRRGDLADVQNFVKLHRSALAPVRVGFEDRVQGIDVVGLHDRVAADAPGAVGCGDGGRSEIDDRDCSHHLASRTRLRIIARPSSGVISGIGSLAGAVEGEVLGHQRILTGIGIENDTSVRPTAGLRSEYSGISQAA